MTAAFALSTSLSSYPYSSVLLRVVLLQFMEEFWYYEFQNHTYSQQIRTVHETIGNMNRKKFVPVFVKAIVGQDFYDSYE